MVQDIMSKLEQGNRNQGVAAAATMPDQPPSKFNKIASARKFLQLINSPGEKSPKHELYKTKGE